MPQQGFPKIAGYRLVKQVGGGGFSIVYQAVHIEDHRVAACKVVSLTPKTTNAERKSLDKEMRVHSALKHKNVLEFINAVIVEPDGKTPYYPAFYMLLEFAAGGDLFDKIAPDVGIGEDIAHHYFLQLLAGMSFIHGEGVCHRDLKPENILLDAAGALKISDFGLSSVYKLKETGRTRQLSERCGSLPYVAPELNSNSPYDAEPVDVWGIGVILFTLLLGNTPWDEPTARSPEFKRYVSGQIYGDDPWTRLGDNVLSLILALLTIDPHKRMTLPEAFQHPWVYRQSQMANKGPVALAESLTQSLRESGDMAMLDPSQGVQTDADGDEMMMSATHQFTQSLLLFSQTQHGTKYTPAMTRFYASIPPAALLSVIEPAFASLGAQTKRPDQVQEEGHAKCFVRALDGRKQVLKGWIEVQPFEGWGSVDNSFCIMRRIEGDPIQWRKLWRAMIETPFVAPYAIRRDKAGNLLGI
ncbi:Pkinase-domain-containing protein [Auriscalpium vulgare]|uniref:Pkinase-domain-containing protein n=1 Tax=Auriscalpium vulgare TaxID=40419 RepID=A0ACB8S643_9AGAM|nr:Pkinase-domain-containing protein [Auriscalpium vulgare]